MLKLCFQGFAGQLDTLRACLSPAALRRALKSLPETLDKTYDRILTSIPKDYHRQAHTVLQWLVFSARPLQLIEVAEAVAVNPGSISLGEEDRLFDHMIFCQSVLVWLHYQPKETRYD
jgi:hypothetical protein